MGRWDVGYGMKGAIAKGAVWAPGLLAVAALATAGSLGAQDYDDGEGWWEAEEFADERASDLQFKEFGSAASLQVGYDRDPREARDRRDRQDRRDQRVRGRQRAVVIPSGRVQVRPRVVLDLRRDYARGAGYGWRPTWHRMDWEVRFRRGYRAAHRYDRAQLRDILDRRTIQRLQRHRNRLDARGRLTYRWRDLGRRGVVLQVRAGRTPIAEFVDFGRDGWVEVVRLSAY